MNFSFFSITNLIMIASQADSVCYTLINFQIDSESINEQNLKNDLGMLF